MARFKVSDLLKKRIMRQLYLRGITFKEVEEDGIMYLELPEKISGKEFHRIVTRARMEYLQKEYGISAPIFTEEEIRKGLPCILGKTAYVCLDDVKHIWDKNKKNDIMVDL